MFDYQEVQMKENNIKENDFFFHVWLYHEKYQRK